ncbi:MAG: very short patch repair endonuclease [Clostridia bacterium]|nr:very short patch repair endonuclease [Clostridia bacterium]
MAEVAERAKETTHRIMSAVKAKDTEPELMLRKALWSRGLRYRKNYRLLPGKPDVVFTRAKIAVFCDGDYWHGHNWALRGLSSLEEELASYSDFWRKKITKNIEHDKKVTAQLEALDWLVIRVWESDIRANIDSITDRIIKAYQERTTADQV